MWFFTNMRVKRERLLLKRCHDNDDESLVRFATRSYKSEVERTVRLTLRQSYRPEEVEDAAKMIITKIYSLWYKTPSPFATLHRRVRDAAKKLALDYIEADLEA